MKSLTICRFSESVTTSDGYCWGYVSFAHFLLYLEDKKVIFKRNSATDKSRKKKSIFITMKTSIGISNWTTPEKKAGPHWNLGEIIVSLK